MFLLFDALIRSIVLKFGKKTMSNTHIITLVILNVKVATWQCGHHLIVSGDSRAAL